MKSSSANPAPVTIDKPTAWACTLTNAVTLPGLGTIAGGRKVGYVQAAIALVGFLLSLGGLAGHIWVWMERGEMPGVTRSLLVAVIGMLTYGAAWFWALSSSLQLHREARQNPERPAAHDPARASIPPRL